MNAACHHGFHQRAKVLIFNSTLAAEAVVDKAGPGINNRYSFYSVLAN